MYYIRYGAHGYSLTLELESDVATDINRAKNAAQRLYGEGFYCGLCKKLHGVSWVEVWKGFSKLYLRIPEREEGTR